jgi:hypothetical protein
MFGAKRGKSTASVDAKIQALRVQTSAYGQPIKIVYGTQRISDVLLDFDDFIATAHVSQQTQGGKGGPSAQTNTTTTYTYSVAFIGALCEGPIAAILDVWDTKGHFPVQTSSYTAVVPGGLTITVPQAANFTLDIGATRADAFSIPVDDYGDFIRGHHTFVGTQQTPLTLVGSAPAAGQYSQAAGVYTFNVAELGQTITIKYVYSTPTASGNGQPLGQLGLTLFKGARPATAWTYMTTRHPSKALAYSGLANVANSSMDCGSSGTLPNLSFEVVGLLPFAGQKDCNPKSILVDMLTSTLYGLGWSASKIGDLTQWSNYCVASGTFLSLAIESQSSVTELVQELLDATNSAAFWSQGKLKIMPYGDSTLVGNGVTYSPATTPIYDLTDDDFQADSAAPVKIIRGTVADAFNDISIEWVNRANAYNPEIMPAHDQASIEAFGKRTKEPLALHCIADKAVAQTAIDAMLKRSVYIRNKYQFKLSWKYFLLEPMDLVTLTDAALGLNKTPVRITSITEDDTGILTFEAEEFPFGTATATLYPKQDATSAAPNQMIDGGAVNTPIIFEPPQRVCKNNANEIWLGVSGADLVNWGGASVWVSPDNTTYKNVGRIYGAARMGATSTSLPLALDPDTVNTLQLDFGISNGQLITATQQDADNYRDLILIEKELMSYKTSNLVSGHIYDATYLRRGLFGTSRAAHLSGVSALRCDDAVFVLNYDPAWVGKKIYVKLTSFNQYGLAEQSLASATAYQYTIQGPTAISGTQSYDFLIHTGTSSGAGDSFRKISSQSYVIQSGDFLEYDIYCDPNNPECREGIEFDYGGSPLSFRLSGILDQNGIASTTDIATQAKGQFYHRKFPLSTLAGQTINGWATFIGEVIGTGAGGVAAGLYKHSIANVKVTNGGVASRIVFDGSNPLTAEAPVYFAAETNWSGSLVYSSHVYPRGYDLGGDGVIKAGSTAPSWTGAVSFTTTTTSVTFSFTNIVIHRSNNTSVPLATQSFAITGLTANTQYYFYPYFDEPTMTIKFVANADVAGAVGTGAGAFAYTAKTSRQAAFQSLQTHVPLSNGAINAPTPSAGTGGGSGGGDGLCLHADSLVETQRGVVKLIDAREGDSLRTRPYHPDYAPEETRTMTLLVQKTVLEQNVFVRVKLSDGNSIRPTPTHRCTVLRDDVEVRVPAQELTLSDMFITRRGIAFITSITVERKRSGLIWKLIYWLTRKKWLKVAVTCHPEHTFFAGDVAPDALSHNMNPGS